MKLSEDELIEILSDVTTMLGTALAQHVDLNESLLDQNAGAQTKKKIDALKAKLDGEKLKLRKLRDAQQRRRELEKIRKDHEHNEVRTPANESKNAGTVTLRDGGGRVVGYMRCYGKGRTDFLSASGKLVAREMNGKTYDVRTGRLAAPDLQGLRVLGQSLKK